VKGIISPPLSSVDGARGYRLAWWRPRAAVPLLRGDEHAHHHLGHHPQALTCYQHALDLFRDLGDRYEEAATLTRLGDTHHAAGDLAAARDTWQRALVILDELDHPYADQVRAKLATLDGPNADDPG
jgi:tetratricopeptide (TPR) repeat protein